MGKGPQDTRTPDHRKRRENHARIDWRTKEEREAERAIKAWAESYISCPASCNMPIDSPECERCLNGSRSDIWESATEEQRDAARVPEVFDDLPVFEPFKEKGKGKRVDAV